MLIIRKEQIKALDEYMLKSFHELVFSHLKRVFPRHCQEIGEAVVRDSIRKGIELAGKYEITSKIDVVGFVDLIYVHGWDLNRGILLAWALSILNDVGSSAGGKMKRLYELTEQELGFSSKGF